MRMSAMNMWADLPSGWTQKYVLRDDQIQVSKPHISEFYWSFDGCGGFFSVHYFELL